MGSRRGRWLLRGGRFGVALATLGIGVATAQEPGAAGDPAVGEEPESAATLALETVPTPDLSALEASVAEQLREAREQMLDAISGGGLSDAGRAEAFGLVGQLYHVYELLEPAAACYRNALELAPEELRWIQLLARLEEKAGRLDNALELYRRVRRHAPGYVAAAAREADILMQLERPAEARQALEAALALAPDSPAVHYGLGQLALAADDLPRAVEAFERTLELQPAADRVHYPLAMAYRRLGDRERAMQHLDRSGTVGVRVADPIYDELEGLVVGERVHVLRGRLAYGAGRMEEARAEFAQALEASPTSVPARTNLAATLAALGEVEAAKRELLEVLELRPEEPTAHFNLAALLVGEGDHDRAVEHFRAAVEAKPRDAAALRQLALSLLELDRQQEGLEILSRYVDLTPADEDLLLTLVEMLLDRERYREAYERLDLSNALFPDRGRTAHDLARLLASSPELALRDGERSLELAEMVFSARRTLEHGETLALALAEAGRCEEATALQGQLVQTARERGQIDEARRLAKALEHYVQGSPCRPGVERERP
jgi:tetratricopeptide (TPR) repeat protein